MSLTSTISYRSYQPIGNHEYPVLRKKRNTFHTPDGLPAVSGAVCRGFKSFQARSPT